MVGQTGGRVRRRTTTMPVGWSGQAGEWRASQTHFGHIVEHVIPFCGSVVGGATEIASLTQFVTVPLSYYGPLDIWTFYLLWDNFIQSFRPIRSSYPLSARDNGGH